MKFEILSKGFENSRRRSALAMVFQIALVLFVVSIIPASGYCQTETPLWTEDFEGGWMFDWSITAGTWQVGVPSSGPGRAIDTTRCAATVLAGNYPEGVSSRLKRETTFVVPPASENPRLRFWHWYSFSCSDYGYVEIRTGTSGAWTKISDTYTWSGCGVWSRAFVDLSAWADSTVQIAFYFKSVNQDTYSCGYGNPDVSSGWYVDLVEVVSDPIPSFDYLEDFASGIDDWYVSHGIWQVGKTTYGPSAYSDSMCAATKLHGQYCDGRSSRLVSPSFTVPPESENPRLRFQHWYSFSCSDYGRVQIRPLGGSWVDLSTQYTWSGCSVWSRPWINLTAWADTTVQVAFYFKSVNQDTYSCGYGNVDVSGGWYVDDVEIETGPVEPFDNPEYWESGIDQWRVTTGTWQVGAPTTGPGAARTGNNCAATRLHGNYCDGRNSRLVSPPFVVPDAALSPRFIYWHWFNFNCGDYGEVQVWEASSGWTTLSTRYVGAGTAWTLSSVDLSAFANLTVYLAFYFYSVNVDTYSCGYGNADVSSGWYIDDMFLIGAYTPTLLQRQRAIFRNGEIEIEWELIEAGDEMQFNIFRENLSDGIMAELDAGGLTNDALHFEYVDADIAAGVSYRYQVFISDEDGRRLLFTTDDVATEAFATKLEQNVPNPFNPVTTITYAVGETGNVSLKIYDTRGALVTSLYDGPRAPGRYKATWDGRNRNGDRVATGVYFYRVTIGKFSQTRKMVLLK